jgi:hypothetical protein
MTFEGKNVIVAGMAGAYVPFVCGYLASKGWQICWPKQDINVSRAREYLTSSYQNLEVQRVHEEIFASVGLAALDDTLPLYFDIPYPGPQEITDKFTNRAVIAAPSLPIFMDIWRVAANSVIHVNSTLEDDLRMLRVWTRDSFSDEKLKSIRDQHRQRYTQHLKLFPFVFEIDNADVKAGRFDLLDSFLSSRV